MPWPLVQQSLAIGLDKGKLKFSRLQYPQKMIKKSDFPIPILTSCLQSVIAPKRIDRFWFAWCQLLAFFKLYMIHVRKSKIDQEKAELWGAGCQSPPDAWFSHSNFGHLSKKCPSSQIGRPIFIRLVAFACIFEVLSDSCQKIKNRSRKSRVMG